MTAKYAVCDRFYKLYNIRLENINAGSILNFMIVFIPFNYD